MVKCCLMKPKPKPRLCVIAPIIPLKGLFTAIMCVIMGTKVPIIAGKNELVFLLV